MNVRTQKVRDYRIDNIKGILICLVVFGHLLELVIKNNSVAHMLYSMIYMFHMPLFIFTTGYFAKFKLKKLMCNLVYPYLVFQTIYLLFVRFVLQGKDAFQYGTPYWLLWYLFAVAIWTATEPLWNASLHRVKQVIILSVFIGIALLCGKISFIGREYSLSRIFVFFPFFIAGAYTRKWINPENINRNINRNNIDSNSINRNMQKIIIIIMAIASMLVTALYHTQINRNWLYEATSYETSHYGIGFRTFHILTGFMMIMFFMILVSNRKFPVINKMGTHTLQIFLLHGFIIKLMTKANIGAILTEWCNQIYSAEYIAAGNSMILSNIIAVMILFMTAIIIVMILSTEIITFILKPFTSFDFFLKQRKVK